MKKALIIPFSCLMFGAFAQTQQHVVPCYTQENHEHLIQTDPAYRANQQQIEQQMQEYVSTHPQGESSRSPMVIPVVFHVLHQYGSENISKEQILDQIRILNEDYSRSNPDTANTPGAFKSVAGNPNIEFRLAQKDPNGNCTDGILRIYSPLTNAVNPRDNLKSASYWNSKNYLNIWVVKEINNGGVQGGIILGYAQFPGGAAATDGVVLRSDVVGAIGTSSYASVGRAATHEVGHWLSLRHIWGDATCGDDFVNDTPVHEAANSGCPTFPYNVNSQCNPGPNGEMFTNYMDYSNGVCQNMFTQGQIARFDATLSSTRANLISASNLANTGVDGSAPNTCVPQADFTPYAYKTVCEGGTVTFSDKSWGVAETQRSWSFPGGTPSTDTSATPTVTYSTAGTYDVTLTASNANGSTNKVSTGKVIVFPGGDGTYLPPYSMGFEDQNQFNNDITIINEDNDVRKWSRVTNAGKGSSSSLKLDNSNIPASGYIDGVMTPSFNLQGATNVKISFDYSFVQKNSTNDDKMQLLVSTNCGQTWVPRWTGSGTALAYTNTTQNATFTPTTANQWKTQTISIPSSFTKANTKFKIEFTSGRGNNIYLDNINIDGTVGIAATAFDESSLVVFPNPSNGNTQIIFTAPHAIKGSLIVNDLLGKEIFSITGTSFNEGENKINLSNKQLNHSGLYFVTIKTDLGTLVKKVIVE